jgi:hypothetical protein
MQALLAVLGWQSDLQGLSQLSSIKIISGKQYCPVSDSLVNRLELLQASLSWFRPGADLSWMPELLGIIPGLSEAVYQAREPAPDIAPDRDLDLNVDNDPALKLTAKDVLGPSDYRKLHNPPNCDRPKGW